MKKKILASLLALCMIVAMLPISAFAAEAKFTDTANHWGKVQIERWEGYGVLNGVGGGAFEPDRNMTRAEFAQMLCNLMGYEKMTDPNPFADVTADNWKGEALLKLCAAGVSNGAGTNSEGKTIAAPDSPITREMAAVMLGRALKIKPDSAAPGFADDAKISSWAKGYVAALKKAGWVSGVGKNMFDPKAYLNRAMGAQMMGNMVTVYVTGEEEVTVSSADVKGGVVVVAGKGKVNFTAETTAPVIVAPKSNGATVDFKAGSSAADVVVMGKDTTVTGQGDVDDVEVTKEATGDIEVSTPDTDVVNNSGVVVDTPAGEIAANGGEGNTTPEPVEEIDVVVAGLNPVDNSSDAVAIDAKVTASFNKTNKTITLTADKAVPKHENGNGDVGYWVGVAFKAPEKATGFKYAFTASGELKTSTLEEIGENINPATGVATFDKGATFWFDVDEGTTANIQLQWTGDELTEAEKAVQAYAINMTGVAPKVDVVVAGLNPVDNSSDAVAIDAKVTATLSGNTITLTADKAVPAHENDNGAVGYWVGVAFKAPEGATGFKYAFAAKGNLSGSEVLEEIGENLNSDDAFTEGATFWFDISKLDATKKATIRLGWTGDNLTNAEKKVQQYTIDMTSVTKETMMYNLTVNKVKSATSDNGESTKVVSIKVGNMVVYRDSDPQAADLADILANVRIEEGAEVTVTVETNRNIAVLLMAEGMEADETKNIVKVNQATKTESPLMFTDTITFKMPFKAASLTLGVLEACKTEYEPTVGLSACQANNEEQIGIWYEGKLAEVGEGETPPETPAP